MTAVAFPVVTTFHDRRTDSTVDFNFAPTREERLHSLYGSGEEGMARLFGGHPTTPVPWQRASMMKKRQPYDSSLVAHELTRPIGPEGLSHVDPRHLVATQAGITHAGVQHYMSNQFREHGRTFADQHMLGNQHPFVYAREKPGGGHEELLLSGHHRATAALLRGEPLHARRVVGGWGPQR